MTCCPCLPSPLGASSPAEPMVAVPSNLKASLGPSSGAKNLRLNKDEERDAGLGPYTRESSLIGKNGKAGWVLLLLSHSWDSGVTAGHAFSGSGGGVLGGEPICSRLQRQQKTNMRFSGAGEVWGQVLKVARITGVSLPAAPLEPSSGPTTQESWSHLGFCTPTPPPLASVPGGPAPPAASGFQSLVLI